MNMLGQVFGSASSLNASGGTSPVLRRTERFTFVRGNLTRFGASQPTIAVRLNRHERTARRRLSKTYRAKRQERVGEGLLTLNRAQIVVQTNVASKTFRFEQAQNPFDAFLGFEAYGRVWRICLNLYGSSLEVKGQKRLNNQIHRLDLLDGFTLPCKPNLEASENGHFHASPETPAKSGF